MLAAQTALATRGAGVRRGRGGRALGFSAFGDVITGGLGGVIDVAVLQRALNAAYSPSGTVLAVDGVMGSKTRARIAEFKQFLGFPASSTVDEVLITALGLRASASGPGSVGAGVRVTAGSGDGYYDERGVWRGGATEIGTDVGTDYPGNTDSTSTAGDNLLYALSLGLLGKPPKALTDATQAASAATLAAAREAVKVGGDAAKGALQLLADNGDWIAKAAVALGVSYAIATAIVFGGGALALIVFLKRK